jgi:hypothetical protein
LKTRFGACPDHDRAVQMIRQSGHGILHHLASLGGLVVRRRGLGPRRDQFTEAEVGKGAPCWRTRLLVRFPAWLSYSANVKRYTNPRTRAAPAVDDVSTAAENEQTKGRFVRLASCPIANAAGGVQDAMPGAMPMSVRASAVTRPTKKYGNAPNGIGPSASPVTGRGGSSGKAHDFQSNSDSQRARISAIAFAVTVVGIGAAWLREVKPDD